jgi:hypothetical protein
VLAQFNEPHLVRLSHALNNSCRPAAAGTDFNERVMNVKRILADTVMRAPS